jgi:hypothetical protein
MTFRIFSTFLQCILLSSLLSSRESLSNFRKDDFQVDRRLLTTLPDDCSAEFKVFVYDLPSSFLQVAEEARSKQLYHICNKCIYEQFVLEYIMYDYFTQFCGRTRDPEEADFFYLPVIRDLDYRIALLTTKKGGNARASSPSELAILDAIENQNTSLWKSSFNITDDYWRRANGSDHIFVMPAPVTNFRHQTNMRGFFHYVSLLRSLVSEFFLSFFFSFSLVSG